LSCINECGFIPVQRTDPAEFETFDVACWHHSLYDTMIMTMIMMDLLLCVFYHCSPLQWWWIYVCVY